MSNEELVAGIQRGEDRMGELWERIEKLVMWKAHRVMTALEGSGGVEFEDLYQSGYPAMVAAVGSHKPECGAFSTWFMLHLKTAFAEATGYRSKKQKLDPLHWATRLDTPLTDEADSDDLMDVIADPSGQKGLEAAEEAMYQVQLHEALEKALAAIPEQYADVLRLRHYQDMTLAEVGDLKGVGQERVRQMENKAIRCLRKPSVACNLRPFLDFDFYCGTGLGAFQHSGLSIQERYLVLEEEKMKRAERQRRNRERKCRQEKIQIEVQDTMESIHQAAQEKVARMTPEEKRSLLEKYGYV